MSPDHLAPSEVSLAGREKLLLVVTERDIVFHCPKCQGQLVVDRDGTGLEVPCSHCGQPLTVPAFQPQAAVDQPEGMLNTRGSSAGSVDAPARTFDFSGFSAEQVQRRLDELKHQLKENRSQDTEMRGHVNRARMELHRLQLRLKTLQERHADIEAELAALNARSAIGS